MNDREKLIELLCVGYHQRVDDICEKYENCDDCPYNKAKSCAIEINVDHLITNGVTVRKQGKWEQVFYHYKPFVPKFDEWYGAILKCSICGREEIEDDDNNYCPNCGADMRGEEHETD